MTKLTTTVPIMSALAGVALNSGVATAQYAPSSSYASFGATPGNVGATWLLRIHE